MKNSARLGTNTSTPPDISPGSVSGSSTVRNTRQGFAPRSRPASVRPRSSFSALE